MNTKKPERYFTVNGFDLDLEQLADRMTSEDRPEEAKISCICEDGVTRELSAREHRINAYFGREFRDETSLKKSLAITRYFLQTGRPLLPEMVELLSDGITARMNNKTPWGLPSKKPPTDFEQLCFVAAIDKKFRRKTKVIGDGLGISKEAVIKQIQKVKKTGGFDIFISGIEMHLPENIHDCIKLMKDIERRNFYLWRIYTEVIRF